MEEADLNGSSGCSLMLRVPSGNRISEEPASSAFAIKAIGVLLPGLRIAVDQHRAEYLVAENRRSGRTVQ